MTSTMSDKNDLNSSLKSLTSTTLSARLTGLGHISGYITELMMSSDQTDHSTGEELVRWIISNQIIETIFGPNLHLEVIKQSMVLIAFVANSLTPNHLDVIWSAALHVKHTQRQVIEILINVVKQFRPTTLLHLNHLLRSLKPADYTEQILLLIQQTQKIIWSTSLSLQSNVAQLTANSQSSAAAAAAVACGLLEESLLNSGCSSHQLSSRSRISESENITFVLGSQQSQQHAIAKQNESNSSPSPSTSAAAGGSPMKGSIVRPPTSIPPTSSSGSDEEEEEDDDDEDDEDEEEEEEEEEDEDSEERSEQCSDIIPIDESRAVPMGPPVSPIMAPSLTSTPLISAHLAPRSGKDLVRILSSRSGRRSRSHNHRRLKRRRLELTDDEEEDDNDEEDDDDDDEEEEDEEEDEDDEDDELSIDDDLEYPSDDKQLIAELESASDAEKVIILRKFNQSRKRLKHQEHIISVVSDDDDLVDEDLENDEESSKKREHLEPLILSIPRKQTISSYSSDKNDGSNSCHSSQASDKNLADFEDEDEPEQLPRNSSQAGRCSPAEIEEEDVDPDSRPSSSLDAGHVMHPSPIRPQPSVFRPFSKSFHSTLEMFIKSATSPIMSDFIGRRSSLPATFAKAHCSSDSGSDHTNATESDEMSMQEQLILFAKEIDQVCAAGNTLLWDLLDDSIMMSLPYEIAREVERSLYNLITSVPDFTLRIKFVQGCLRNLATERAVLVSIRLLFKLLSSLKTYANCLAGGSPGSEHSQHFFVMQAEKNDHMLDLFFTNLRHYTEKRRSEPGYTSLPIYSHQEEMHTRLTFLAFIFSASASPESFTLSREQVDTLWDSMATDQECCDDLFRWFKFQLTMRDEHGLAKDQVLHLFMEKIPALPPDSCTAAGIELMHVLMNHLSNENEDVEKIFLSKLWEVALRAKDLQVSHISTLNLNHHYLYTKANMQREEEFVDIAMNHLRTAMSQLPMSEDLSLLIIARTLSVIHQHIHQFRAKYSYHLRKWILNHESQLVLPHFPTIEYRKGPMFRLTCQAQNVSEKFVTEMNAHEHVGELRAEIYHWWRNKRIEKGDDPAALPSESYLRLSTAGQDMQIDRDFRHICDEVKDGQHFLLSISHHPRHNQTRRGGKDSPFSFVPPPKDKSPFVVLLKSKYFNELFDFMQVLNSLRTPHFRAAIMSRRIWDTIMLLPTNPDMLSSLEALPEKVMDSTPELLQELINTSNAPKLLYSVQIMDLLIRRSPNWAKKLIDCGGLKHLINILILSTNRDGDDEDDKTHANGWKDWRHECLSNLIQLIFSIGIERFDHRSRKPSGGHTSGSGVGGGGDSTIVDSPTSSPEPHPSGSWSRKRKRTCHKTSHHHKHDHHTSKRSFVMQRSNVVATFSKNFLSLIDNTEELFKVLISLLTEALHRPDDMTSMQSGYWGRSMIISIILSFLSAWSFGDHNVGNMFLDKCKMSTLLRRLTLDDPDHTIRREACAALYRLVLGTSMDGSTSGRIFAVPLLEILLSFLPYAQTLKSCKSYIFEGEMVLEKESYGPGNRDYFWLVIQLVDTAPNSTELESLTCISSPLELCHKLADDITHRKIIETRNRSDEDESLRGLMALMCALIKHAPSFKKTDRCLRVVSDLFNSLFAAPTLTERNLPKCKAMSTRSIAFDLLAELVRGCEANYLHLIRDHVSLQHRCENPQNDFPWDYWPHDDCRSDCGYVGLINLGATCYMATCMQHLFMIPQVRYTLLSANQQGAKHSDILVEMQRMFAYLLESERKAYNPRDFCRVYTMNGQLLNTGEQKDMTEFFTDLIAKVEEMSPDLARMVKSLFAGVLSNNVVSLDCPHSSRTTEVFYSLRCQVPDMKSLEESLNELTVKDTLEGDNMYSCRCGKKVRAEKRACIRTLPKILPINIMRYTFSPTTGVKEKVNTRFSFPMILDMSPYLEKNLVPVSSTHEMEDGSERPESKADTSTEEVDEETRYRLIGVTVHTGTADGGHYYCFIRELEEEQQPSSQQSMYMSRVGPAMHTGGKSKWYLFNDAEVKPFDENQLDVECFGGETTNRTYDIINDKILDFSYEKTNSAYMLFYEKVSDSAPSSIFIDVEGEKSQVKSCASNDVAADDTNSEKSEVSSIIWDKSNFKLDPSLSRWIWDDNTRFLRDKNLFDHQYFEFMWQMSTVIPHTLPDLASTTDITLQMATSFFLTTLIHSKEKPTTPYWIEILSKQFIQSHATCAWFLDTIATYDNWPLEILLKCPNQMVRQLFHRLVIHVINQLRPEEHDKYLPFGPIVASSCVTRAIRKLLTLITPEYAHIKPPLKHLTEYFTLLHDFAKMGDIEKEFLLSIDAISTMIQFYLAQCHPNVLDTSITSDTPFTRRPGPLGGPSDLMSDDEDDDDDGPLHPGILPLFDRPASLDKMMALIASLVEKSRGDDNQLHLSSQDMESLTGPINQDSTNGFLFLQQAIRDNINLGQTCNLIFSLVKWNEPIASQILAMIFDPIQRFNDPKTPYVKILSMILDLSAGRPAGLPNFSNLILPQLWSHAEHPFSLGKSHFNSKDKQRETTEIKEIRREDSPRPKMIISPPDSPVEKQQEEKVAPVQDEEKDSDHKEQKQTD